MPAVLGNIIVLAVLAVAISFAVRSLRKSRKAGGHCTGGCSACHGCGTK